MRNSHTPVGNATFTTDDILAICDMEMRTLVAPKISSTRENYWLTTHTQDINSSLNKYAIPSKSIGSSFVDVKVKSNTIYFSLGRIEVGEILSDQFASRGTYSYYLEDNSIRLLPPNIPGQVVIWYYRIPSQLVPVSECAQITAINGDVVTVDAVPSTFPNQELDIVSEEPGFNVLVKDTEPTLINSLEITFASLPSSVEVGDYVCLAGQSCVVQSPLEWVEVLVQAATVKIYEIQGYGQKHKLAMETLNQMVERTMGIISPRAAENSKIIPGGGSLLRTGRRGWKLPVSSA